MKMKLLTTATSVLALAIAAQANAGVVTSKGDDLVISTKSGLKVATADGNTSFAVGGRIQWDYANIDVNGDNVINDTYIRRARVFFKGHNGDWAYKAQYNLDDNRGVLKRKGGVVEDLYIRYTGFGKAANITVGKQKAPFGLEQLTSSKDITSLERSASTVLFTAGRHVGLQLHGATGMFSYGIGAFEADKEFIDSDGKFFDKDDNGNDDGAGSIAVVGRVTAAPINEDGSVLHFGAGFIQAPDDSQNFRLKDVYNLEVAGVAGPFHYQAEYFDGTDADSYYAQVGWVLTGESRPYKKGVFKRIKPKSDSGAWELVARYNDGSGDFGELSDAEAKSYLFGVNWYATNNVRIGANYSTIEADSTNNDADIFQMRIQYVYE
jgi:phosphate-selective porin OprO/OprP